MIQQFEIISWKILEYGILSSEKQQGSVFESLDIAGAVLLYQFATLKNLHVAHILPRM